MKQKSINIIIGIIVVVLIINLVLLLAVLAPTGRVIEGESYEIGAVTPLSGKLAIYGQWQRNGMDLALEEVNKEKDFQLKIIYEDTQGDATQAVSAAQKLINSNKVSIIFGSLSHEVLGMAPITEENKVILFTPGAGSEDIRQAGDYVFRNRETGIVHGSEMADLVYSLGFKKTAILYVNAPSGVSYKDGFLDRYSKIKGEIIYNEGYDKGETDFRTDLLKIKSINPDAIYVPGYGADIGIILKQAKELGLTVRFFSSPGIEIPELFDITGNSAEGVIYSVPVFDPSNPSVRSYAEPYKNKYGEESEFIAANSYDAVHILADAIESCNGDDSTCIKNYLYSLRNYPGVGGKTSFDHNGDVIKPVAMKEVRSGKFEIIS
ncbi:MAG: ABC transporter substrate-binding protein [archaeon]